MLAVIEGQDAAGVLLGKTGIEELSVTLGGGAAEGKILGPFVCGIRILLALPIAVVAHGSQVEHLFEFQLALGGLADAVARVAHRLHIEAHAHPVGAGLLHHRMGKPAHVEHDLGVLQRPVMAPLAGQQPLHADLAGPLFIRPVLPVVGHEALAVVLVHAGVHALLGIGRGGDQVDPEAGIHAGQGRASRKGWWRAPLSRGCGDQ